MSGCDFFAHERYLGRCSVCFDNLSAAQLATSVLARQSVPDDLVGSIMMLAHAPMCTALRKARCRDGPLNARRLDGYIARFHSPSSLT
jgi:hypothetical protein